MANKKIIDEIQDVEEYLEKEQAKEVVTEPVIELKKIPHEVVLISTDRVVYKVSDKLGNSTTPLLDVWKGKLKVGDIIYLPEG